MGYTIEGDGTFENTALKKDGVTVPYEQFTFDLDADRSILQIDGLDVGKPESIVINGVYKVIGAGDFTNTKVFFVDEMMRGVQKLTVFIGKGVPSRITVQAILLPNIIEFDQVIKVTN